MAKNPRATSAQLEDENNELLVTHSKVLGAVDIGHLIAAGDMPNHTAFRAFGRNSAVGATFEDIWTPGATHTEITTAAAVYLSSSAGADAQDIVVVGLDGSWAVQTVTQALNQDNGQTKIKVGTTETWMRIFKIYSAEGEVALAGDVYCYLNDDVTAGVPNTATKIQSIIEIGYGRSMEARFTIPADQVGYISTFYGSISAAAAAEINLMYKQFERVVHIRRIMDVYYNGGQIVFPFPLPCPAKSDIYIRAKAAGGAVSGGFAGWYEPE